MDSATADLMAQLDSFSAPQSSTSADIADLMKLLDGASLSLGDFSIDDVDDSPLYHEEDEEDDDEDDDDDAESSDSEDSHQQHHATGSWIAMIPQPGAATSTTNGSGTAASSSPKSPSKLPAPGSSSPSSSGSPSPPPPTTSGGAAASSPKSGSWIAVGSPQLGRSGVTPPLQGTRDSQQQQQQQQQRAPIVQTTVPPPHQPQLPRRDSQPQSQPQPQQPQPLQQLPQPQPHHHHHHHDQQPLPGSPFPAKKPKQFHHLVPVDKPQRGFSSPPPQGPPSRNSTTIAATATAPAAPSAHTPSRRSEASRKPRPTGQNTTGRPELQTIRRKAKKGETLQVGNYQLGEQLGKGAFGVVVKGLDITTGQFVAVKRLPREAIDETKMMQEVEFLRKFQHENIVKYITMISTTHHLNLVLEFVDSGSLAQVLAGYGFFPEPLAAIYIEQVLNGLEYLHSQSVVHRDIKGGNLLITKEGTVKVADFGIATSTTTNPRHSLVEGSPYWMAPEAIELHNPTTASDIWSLGCTVIELLTGFPPYFDMAPVSAVYKMVADEHPPLPEDMSPELESFLLQCFRRLPAERPTASALKVHPWILKHSQKGKKFGISAVQRTIKRYTLMRDGPTKAALEGVDWNNPASIESAAAIALSPSPSASASPSPASLDEDSSPSISSSGGSSSSLGDSEKPPRHRSLSNSGDSDRALHEHEKVKRRSKKKSASLKKRDFQPARKLGVVAAETRRAIFAYTVYKINVTWETDQWTIERTWSDFKELHVRLQKALPQITLPVLPARKFFGVMDPDFIRRRWKELQTYCDELLSINSVCNCEIMLQFVRGPWA